MKVILRANFEAALRAAILHQTAPGSADDRPANAFVAGLMDVLSASQNGEEIKVSK